MLINTSENPRLQSESTRREIRLLGILREEYNSGSIYISVSSERLMLEIQIAAWMSFRNLCKSVELFGGVSVNFRTRVRFV